MITRSRNLCWRSRAITSTPSGTCIQPARRKKGYKVEAASYALFIGALEARRKSWLSKRLRLKTPRIELPPENIAAIRLLDSWLSTPDVAQDDAWEEFKQMVDNYRSSSRKVFA